MAGIGRAQHMNTILLDEAGKLRSGWRAVAFLSAFICTAPLLTILEQLALDRLPGDETAGSTGFTVINAFGLLALAILFGAVFTRWFEDKPFRTLGASLTGRWFQHLVIGLLMGVIGLLVAVLIPFLAGAEAFTKNAVSDEALAKSLLVSFGVFAIAAAWEEAFFRGYLLQTFVRSGSGMWALLGMSLFFGLVHLGNKDATILSGTNTALAGVVFSLAYLKTRDLWFPWGIHLMWNWTQGSIFGIEVSGTTDLSRQPFFQEIDRGPVWLTGGTYGIEGSIACTVALIIIGVLIYVLPGLSADDELLALTSPKRSGS